MCSFVLNSNCMHDHSLADGAHILEVLASGFVRFNFGGVSPSPFPNFWLNLKLASRVYNQEY